MHYKDGDEDTICALSTPSGSGGIAVIRVSGPKAFSVARQLCAFIPEKPESHHIYYGLLRDHAKAVPIDEVLVSCFVEGRSFTGEETAEISCHGGAVIAASVLEELAFAGCRIARRGEFTYRAFMNDRLDLVQAESVLGLIESRSRQAARISLRQLQGQLSSEFARIEDGLLWLLAHLEAQIDFSTEDIEIVSEQIVLEKLHSLDLSVSKLISSYRLGRTIKEGIEVAFLGPPNAGKSSLLNALLGEDRAIVTSTPGTTRDTIEGVVSYKGVPITFVDTAGLRDPESEIEELGIGRSLAAAAKANLVIGVIDIAQGSAALEGVLENLRVHQMDRQPDYWLVNKLDLDMQGNLREALGRSLVELGIQPDRVFWVSVIERIGMDRLEEFLAQFGGEVDVENSNVVTHARHHELLKKIHTCLQAAVGLVQGASSPEFVAFELQASAHAIHELLGKEFDEQVLDRIFKEFCLGK